MSNVDTIKWTYNFNHISVESSRFLSAAWDRETLQIRFKDGSLYNYYNVPEQVYQDLINPALSISKGIFLQKSVIEPANITKLYKRVK